MGRHVKSLEFFDVLLGDRPALSEVDRFYQRTLANDPDEALEQAEKMLLDRPLVDYYDSVVLPALRLATEDERRGTISRQRTAEMIRSILAVVGDLDQHRDESGESISSHEHIQETPRGFVACVAGRGPFDDVVSAMVAQLLAHHGVLSRRVPYALASREAIAHLDLSVVQVTIVSSVELVGAPAHLRYLIRRLRQRAPGAAMIAGLWFRADPVMADAQEQKVIGADGYVASMREALDAALAALNTPLASVAAPESQSEIAASFGIAGGR
jgi:hypothetical protein